MLESKIPSDQKLPPIERLLDQVELSPGLVETLSFRDDLNALVQQSPEDNSFRMVVFRGHSKVEESGKIDAVQLINASSQTPRRSIHGSGLYVGNSRESVGVFSYLNDNREIGVYLTPPIKASDVLDTRTGESTLRRFGKLIVREAMMHTRKGDSILAGIDASYSDRKVVIVDKSPDTVLVQNIEVKDNTYPVTPLWYVLRGDALALERVGTAKPIVPRPKFKALRAYFQKSK